HVFPVTAVQTCAHPCSWHRERVVHARRGRTGWLPRTTRQTPWVSSERTRRQPLAPVFSRFFLYIQTSSAVHAAGCQDGAAPGPLADGDWWFHHKKIPGAAQSAIVPLSGYAPRPGLGKHSKRRSDPP